MFMLCEGFFVIPSNIPPFVAIPKSFEEPNLLTNNKSFTDIGFGATTLDSIRTRLKSLCTTSSTAGTMPHSKFVVSILKLMGGFFFFNTQLNDFRRSKWSMPTFRATLAFSSSWPSATACCTISSCSTYARASDRHSNHIQTILSLLEITTTTMNCTVDSPWSTAQNACIPVNYILKYLGQRNQQHVRMQQRRACQPVGYHHGVCVHVQPGLAVPDAGAELCCLCVVHAAYRQQRDRHKHGE